MAGYDMIASAVCPAEGESDCPKAKACFNAPSLGESFVGSLADYKKYHHVSSSESSDTTKQSSDTGSSSAVK